MDRSLLFLQIASILFWIQTAGLTSVAMISRLQRFIFMNAYIADEQHGLVFSVEVYFALLGVIMLASCAAFVALLTSCRHELRSLRTMSGEVSITCFI